MDDNEIEDIANEVHKIVEDTGTYKRDSEQWHMPDYWKSYWNESVLGVKWYGDCDNFGMSKYVGCLESGVPPDLVNLTSCCVEPFTDQWGHTYSSLADRYHMVCTVDLEKSSLVLDNRYPKTVWQVGDLNDYVWALPDTNPYHHWFMSLNAGIVQKTRAKARQAHGSIGVRLPDMPWRITVLE